VVFRERRLADLGLAAYNTFAQAHNMLSAIDSIGPALQSVGDMLPSAISDDRDDVATTAGKVGLLIALLVASAAVSAGVILTIVLIRRYAGTLPLPAGSTPAASVSNLEGKFL